MSFLIFATMIMNLLPDRKYEKYLHLYVGCLFLIIAASPIADLGGVEEQAAEAFSRLTFVTDAKLLQKELAYADHERMNRLEEQYVEAIELDIQTMAEGLELLCVDAEAVIETRMDEGAFGYVKEIRLVLASADEAEIKALKRRIQTYYGVEERNITVRLQGE